MIRTRDFLLFLIGVAFLVVTITIETAKQWFVAENLVPVVIVPNFIANSQEQKEISAKLVTKDGIDRAGNIARLRKQLASFIATASKTEVIISPPPTEELQTLTTSQTQAVEISGSSLLCSKYQTYDEVWTKQLLNIEEQAGTRVVLEPSSTGGDDVVVILPIRVIGNASNPNCLPTDVVAIAQTGSLIRNGDVAGYRAFPEHILIGYTLDGYSLYGYSERETDRCGGAMVDGTYRYYLANKRETVLDCFVATPISLPNFD